MKARPIDDLPKLARMVSAFERMARVHITIHDARGLSGMQEVIGILPGRFLHRSPFCLQGRFEVAAWNNRCTFDCKTAVYEQLRRNPAPFVKSCWKGVQEVVLPVVRRERVVLVLFAGVFRPAGDVDPGELRSLPEFFLEKFRELPELTDEKVNTLLGLLTILGNALAVELEAIEAKSGTGSREQQIIGFIKDNAHKKVGIKQLAQHLNLSVSRTSHAVREQLGKSFQAALLEERMQRAVHLLTANPHLPVAQIAAEVGFADEHYFMRCFSKYYGMGPRSYQKANESSDNFI